MSIGMDGPAVAELEPQAEVEQTVPHVEGTEAVSGPHMRHKRRRNRRFENNKQMERAEDAARLITPAEIPDLEDAQSIIRRSKEQKEAETKAVEAVKKFVKDLRDLRRELRRQPGSPELHQAISQREKAIRELKKNPVVAGRVSFGLLLEQAKEAESFDEVGHVLDWAVEDSNTRIIDGEELAKVKADEKGTKRGLIFFRKRGKESAYFFQGAVKKDPSRDVIGLVHEIRKAIRRAAENHRQASDEYKGLVFRSELTPENVLARVPGLAVLKVRQDFDSGDYIFGIIAVENSEDGTLTLLKVWNRRKNLAGFLREFVGQSWPKSEKIPGRLFHLIKNASSGKNERSPRESIEATPDEESSVVDENDRLIGNFGEALVEALKKKGV